MKTVKTIRMITSGACGLLLACTFAAHAAGPSSSVTGAAPTTSGNCTPEYDFPTIKKGVIQVAGMNELPSFLASSSSGPFEGFSAELMNEFAKKNCLTVQWTPGTGPATQLLAANGKVDAWVGIIIASPARAKVMNLEQHQLYFEFAGIASKSANGYDSVEQLRGKKVGAVTGSNYVPSLQEAVGKDNAKLYQSSDEAYQDIANGRIDAVITPSTPQGYWVQQHPKAGVVSKIVKEDSKYPVLTQEYKVVWPVNKANPKLAEALSSYFKQVNTSGELKTLLNAKGITDELHFTGR
jgi:polar amino acid transport system substrate-binding protein